MEATERAPGQGTGSIFTRQLVLIFTAGFLYVIGVYLPPPLVAGYSAGLGGSGTWMGLAAGAFYGMSLVTRPAAGYAADRVDRRNMALLGVGGMVLGVLGLPLAASAAQVVLFRALGGAGYACCSVAFSTALAAAAPVGRVGSVIGFYSILQAVAMAIGPTLGLQLSERIGYHGTFLVSGGISLASFAVTLACGRMRPAEIEQSRKLSFFAVEATPLAVNIMLAMIPYSVITAFLKIAMAERNPGIDVSWYFVCFAAAVLALRAALGKTYDTWRYRTFVFIAAPAFAAALLILQVARQTWQIFPVALLMAVGYGIMLPVTQTKCINVVARERQGLANSTYYIGLDAGCTFGPVLAGVLYEHLGQGAMFSALIVCPALILIVLGLFRKRLGN